MTLFPPVRISELRQDVTLKRERLNQTSESLKQTIRDNANPFHFIKNHLGFFLGLAASTVPLFKILNRLVFKKRPEKKEKSFFSRAARFAVGMGGNFLLKAVMPTVAVSVTAVLRSLLKDKD